MRGGETTLDLAPEDVVALPIDELGLRILADFVKDKAWNEHNYLNQAAERYRTGPADAAALAAIAEAMGWLRNRGLVARSPGQTDSSAIFVTRAGRQALVDGVRELFATESLQGLHPAVLRAVRPLFLLGKYELGVFDAMRTVEIRVRALGGFTEKDYGVDLMRKAFGPKGPLTDLNMAKGEQDATRELFAGAYGVLRNPAGHRYIEYDELHEAAEAVHTASLLMRMLDRIDVRLNVRLVVDD
jgi:uncharacterized protein (TIGR02391 family)